MAFSIEFYYAADDFYQFQNYMWKKFNKDYYSQYSLYALPLIPAAFIVFSLAQNFSSMTYLFLGIVTIIIFIIWFLQTLFSYQRKTRRFYINSFGDMKSNQVKLEANEDYLTLKDIYSEQQFFWSAVTDVVDHNKYIFILLKYGKGICIPKKNWNKKINIKDFIAYIKSKSMIQ